MKTASIFQDLILKEKGPAISVLFETSFTKEIRIAMKKGQSMKEHKTSYPIVVHIVSGEIEFGLPDSALDLEEGNLIALEGNIPHSLIAKKDSIFRLTLTKSDETQRVRKVVEG